MDHVFDLLFYAVFKLYLYTPFYFRLLVTPVICLNYLVFRVVDFPNLIKDLVIYSFFLFYAPVTIVRGHYVLPLSICPSIAP